MEYNYHPDDLDVWSRTPLYFFSCGSVSDCSENCPREEMAGTPSVPYVFCCVDRGYVGHVEYDECYRMHDPSDPDMAVIRPSFIYHWEDPEKKMEALLGRFISNHFLHSLAYLGLDRCSLCQNDYIHFPYAEA